MSSCWHHMVLPINGQNWEAPFVGWGSSWVGRELAWQAQSTKPFLFSFSSVRITVIVYEWGGTKACNLSTQEAEAGNPEFRISYIGSQRLVWDIWGGGRGITTHQLLLTGLKIVFWVPLALSSGHLCCFRISFDFKYFFSLGRYAKSKFVNIKLFQICKILNWCEIKETVGAKTSCRLQHKNDWTAILWLEPNAPEPEGLKLRGRETKGISFVLGIN